MINTVTISLSEYEELKSIKTAFEKGLVRYNGSWGHYELMTRDVAIEKLSYQMNSVIRELEELKRRSLWKRIINKQ